MGGKDPKRKVGKGFASTLCQLKALKDVSRYAHLAGCCSLSGTSEHHKHGDASAGRWHSMLGKGLVLGSDCWS